MAYLKRLLSWLASWFRRGDLYAPGERDIFPFWNGARHVKADPLALHRRLMDVWPDLQVDITVAFSPLRDNGKAQEAMARKVRGVFLIPEPRDEIDREGTLSEPALFALLSSFMDYCEAVKKNSPTPPTWPTATSSSTPPSSAGDQPTSPSSGSGSTASAPTSDAPTPPPSEWASP